MGHRDFEGFIHLKVGCDWGPELEGNWLENPLREADFEERATFVGADGLDLEVVAY